MWWLILAMYVGMTKRPTVSLPISDVGYWADYNMEQATTSVTLGAITSLGLFTRITFPIFTFPTLLSHLLSGPRCFRPVISMVAGFFTIAAIFITFDTYYYGFFTLTPLNFLRYNSRTANLAQHGIHPRWLHAVVNMPMLFGPLYLVFLLDSVPGLIIGSTDKSAATATKRRLYPKDPGLNGVMLVTILLPLTLLSVAPHQEPGSSFPFLFLSSSSYPPYPTASSQPGNSKHPGLSSTSSG
jgi:phosphatidylinositol glycan class Z